MNRKLAVPLALGNLWENHENKMERSRKLREMEGDAEDMRVFMTLADNRIRLERLSKDIEEFPEMGDDEEFKDELDYINASIQLGLLEITGELEEIQSSDELFEQATA